MKNKKSSINSNIKKNKSLHKKKQKVSKTIAKKQFVSKHASNGSLTNEFINSQKKSESINTYKKNNDSIQHNIGLSVQNNISIASEKNVKRNDIFDSETANYVSQKSKDDIMNLIESSNIEVKNIENNKSIISEKNDNIIESIDEIDFDEASELNNVIPLSDLSEMFNNIKYNQVEVDDSDEKVEINFKDISEDDFIQEIDKFKKDSLEEDYIQNSSKEADEDNYLQEISKDEILKESIKNNNAEEIPKNDFLKDNYIEETIKDETIKNYPKENFSHVEEVTKDENNIKVSKDDQHKNDEKTVPIKNNKNNFDNRDKTIVVKKEVYSKQTSVDLNPVQKTTTINNEVKSISEKEIDEAYDENNKILNYGFLRGTLFATLFVAITLVLFTIPFILAYVGLSILLIISSFSIAAAAFVYLENYNAGIRTLINQIYPQLHEKFTNYSFVLGVISIIVIIILFKLVYTLHSNYFSWCLRFLHNQFTGDNKKKSLEY